MTTYLTNAHALEWLKWLTAQAHVDPVAPLKLAMMSANGDNVTPGTEITGNSYARVNITWGAPVGTLVKNSANIMGQIVDTAVNKNMMGWEVWDSATTPRRLMRWPVVGTVTILANEPWEIVSPGGEIRLAIQGSSVTSGLCDDLWSDSLKWLTGQAVAADAAGPFEVRLLADNGGGLASGDRLVPGTEIVGDSYIPMPVTFGAPALLAGVPRVENSAAVEWDMLDSTLSTVVYGWEVWDTGVNRRFLWHDMTTLVVPAGEGCRLSSGEVGLSMP